MSRLNINNILSIKELKAELEFEEASSLQGRLRWMSKENHSLKIIHQHLISLIEDYENKYWSKEDEINDEQIKESENAVAIVNAESFFIQKRKNLIKNKLKENKLSQKDLAKILRHRPNYMSELINGVRPFSRDDIIIIHRLFELDLKDLIPPFLKNEVAKHINATLKTIKGNKARLKRSDFEHTT